LEVRLGVQKIRSWTPKSGCGATQSNLITAVKKGRGLSPKDGRGGRPDSLSPLIAGGSSGKRKDQKKTEIELALSTPKTRALSQ